MEGGRNGGMEGAREGGTEEEWGGGQAKGTAKWMVYNDGETLCGLSFSPRGIGKKRRLRAISQA